MGLSPVAPERRWQNHPVVREPDPHRMRSLARWVAAITVSLLPAIGYLLVQSDGLDLSFQVDRLRSENDRLQKQERRLRVERTRLESLNLVERWASEQRNLELPATGRVVIVRPAETRPGELMAQAPNPPPP